MPEQYKVKDFGGDALSAGLFPAANQCLCDFRSAVGRFQAGAAVGGAIAPLQLLPGQIGGYLIDPSGAVLPNAQVSATQLDTGAIRSTVTDYSGRWIVSNMPSGRVRDRSQLARLHARRPLRQLRRKLSDVLQLCLAPGKLCRNRLKSRVTDDRLESQRIERDLKKNEEAAANSASSNVLNLQRRVAGVLPVRVDVPRAGHSYQFVRPLVLDEETKITFTYKTK